MRRIHCPRRLRASSSLPILAAGALLAVPIASARAQQGAVAPNSFAVKSGDHVVFYGDSITEQRRYTVLTEEYIVTRFPKLDVSFTHSGWGGDRVTGGGGGPIDLRLDRDVNPYKPTVVSIMLAMNDGSYRAFDDTIFQTYATGYKHIADKIKQDNPGVRLTFILPSPYDDVTLAPKFDGGYNAVLVRYGDYLKTLAPEEGATIADLNTPVVAMLSKAKDTDGAAAPKIIPDRIHPSWGGHLVMAEALLKSWNAPALVSSVTIDAMSGKSDAQNAQVGKVDTKGADGSISWTETESALPFPILPPDPRDAATFRLALQSSDFIDSLDREMLTVTGVSASNFSLKIDGEDIATFTKDQLAAGVNLATLPTSMLKQAETVALLTVRRTDAHQSRWRDLQVPLGGNKDISENLARDMADLDRLDADLAKTQHDAAQPKSHTFTLVPKP